MKTSTLETFTWVLIYGGLLAVCLGLAVWQQGSVALGAGLALCGGAVVVCGALLIVVRSHRSAR